MNAFEFKGLWARRGTHVYVRLFSRCAGTNQTWASHGVICLRAEEFESLRRHVMHGVKFIDEQLSEDLRDGKADL